MASGKNLIEKRNSQQHDLRFSVFAFHFSNFVLLRFAPQNTKTPNLNRMYFFGFARKSATKLRRSSARPFALS